MKRAGMNMHGRRKRVHAKCGGEMRQRIHSKKGESRI